MMTVVLVMLIVVVLAMMVVIWEMLSQGKERKKLW